MAYAYACERPRTLKAACSVDEFMGLSSNIPTAPLPVIAFQGTADKNVPYTMAKDSVDAWRTIDGLLGATTVTTYESSPRMPGKVTQTTWRGGSHGIQVAFVTIIGGGHEYALPRGNGLFIGFSVDHRLPHELYSLSVAHQDLVMQVV